MNLRGVIQHTSHLQGGSHVRRADNEVATTTTCLLSDAVGFFFDLIEQALEFFSAPTTVGVQIQVEHTLLSRTDFATDFSHHVDGADDFTVDFRDDFGGEDVGQFGFGVQTVDSLQVLSQFDGVLSLQSTGLSDNARAFDGETHFLPRIAFRAQAFSHGRRHTRTRTEGRAVSPVRALVRTGTREGGVSFVVESFSTVLGVVARAHCEDQARRHRHRLHTADVEGDQLGHSTTDEVDQHRVVASHLSVRTSLTHSHASTAVVHGQTMHASRSGFHQRHAHFFVEHVGDLTAVDGGFLLHCLDLVFDQDSRDFTTMLILNFRATRHIKDGLPFLCKLRHCVSNP